MSQPQQVIVGKEHAMQSQFTILLSVVDKLESALATEHAFTGQTRTPIDGGARSAMEMVLIQACNRLDSLITNDRNWGAKDQDKVLKAICETHKAQQAFLEEQKLSAAEVRRPAFQFRPDLSCDGTCYIAVYGDPTVPGNYIVGTGTTPEAALLDFDEAFKRTHLEQRTIIHEQPQKKKRKLDEG